MKKEKIKNICILALLALLLFIIGNFFFAQNEKEDLIREQQINEFLNK